MEDEDPYAEEMLEKSGYIVEILANNIHLFSDEQCQELLLMQQSMEYHLKKHNNDRAIIECRNLYNYLKEITN